MSNNDLSKKADSSALNGYVTTASLNNYALKTSLSNYATVSALNTTNTNLSKKADATDLNGYATLTGLNTANTNMGKIKTYVGTDGKLHFTNSAGADTALNFSSGFPLNDYSIYFSDRQSISSGKTKTVNMIVSGSGYKLAGVLVGSLNTAGTVAGSSFFIIDLNRKIGVNYHLSTSTSEGASREIFNSTNLYTKYIQSINGNVFTIKNTQGNSIYCTVFVLY